MRITEQAVLTGFDFVDVSHQDSLFSVSISE